LKKCTKNGVISELGEAISEAENIGIKGRELEQAKDKLIILQQEEEKQIELERIKKSQRRILKKTTKTGSIAEIEQAIEESLKIGLNDEDIQPAKEQILLKKQEICRKELDEAIEKKDISLLQESIERAKELGVSVQGAKKTLKSILKATNKQTDVQADQPSVDSQTTEENDTSPPETPKIQKTNFTLQNPIQSDFKPKHTYSPDLHTPTPLKPSSGSLYQNDVEKIILSEKFGDNIMPQNEKPDIKNKEANGLAEQVAFERFGTTANGLTTTINSNSTSENFNRTQPQYYKPNSSKYSRPVSRQVYIPKQKPQVVNVKPAPVQTSKTQRYTPTMTPQTKPTKISSSTQPASYSTFYYQPGNNYQSPTTPLYSLYSDAYSTYIQPAPYYVNNQPYVQYDPFTGTALSPFPNRTY